jgi:hypothetical protein
MPMSESRFETVVDNVISFSLLLYVLAVDVRLSHAENRVRGESAAESAWGDQSCDDASWKYSIEAKTRQEGDEFNSCAILCNCVQRTQALGDGAGSGF